MNNLCNRCGSDKQVDTIGLSLTYFVCGDCRNDQEKWSFKEPQEVREIESSVEYPNESAN